jgi:hypothetical protein
MRVVLLVMVLVVIRVCVPVRRLVAVAGVVVVVGGGRSVPGVGDRIGHEPLSAAGGAKEIALAAVGHRVRRVRWVDTHPAHGVSGMRRRLVGVAAHDPILTAVDDDRDRLRSSASRPSSNLHEICEPITKVDLQAGAMTDGAWDVTWIWVVLGLAAVWAVVVLVCRAIIGSRTRDAGHDLRGTLDHRFASGELDLDPDFSDEERLS